MAAAARAASGGRGWWPGGMVIAAVTTCQLLLALTVLEPGAFFSGDAGVKYLQARALVASGWRSTAVHTAADHLDPEGRYSFLSNNQFDRAADGSFHGRYSLLFVLPVSLLLALFGERGLYLVTILATTATLLLTQRLAARGAGRVAWLAPLLVGACTPMVFYSLDLWEHTLAVSLTTAAVALALDAAAGGDARRAGLAGLAFGAAVAVREECLALAPAAIIVLAAMPPARRLKSAVAAAAGAGLSLAPYALHKWSQTGAPARPPLLRLLGLAESKGLSAATIMTDALSMLVPLTPWAIGGLAMLVVARAASVRATPARRRVWLALLAAAIPAWGMGAAVWYRVSWTRPDALVAVFPALLGLLLLRRRDGEDDRARREVLGLVVIATQFAVAIAVTTPIGTGIIGGAQWGPRFMMPVYPLFAAAIAFVLARRFEWDEVVAGGGRLVAWAIAGVTLASFAVQVQGVRELHGAKASYARLGDAMIAAAPNGPLVTDVGWVGTVTTGAYPLLLVNAVGTGTLAELLAELESKGIARLTFVGGYDTSAAVHDTLMRAGWNAGTRTIVPLWHEIALSDYEMSSRRGP